MATPRERFAEALTFLKGLQDQGTVGIHTDDIPNVRHRQLLVKNGFLQEVTKGWYIATDPNGKDGETTAWYSSYWEFIARFLRLIKNWRSFYSFFTFFKSNIFIGLIPKPFTFF